MSSSPSVSVILTSIDLICDGPANAAWISSSARDVIKNLKTGGSLENEVDKTLRKLFLDLGSPHSSTASMAMTMGPVAEYLANGCCRSSLYCTSRRLSA